MGECLKCMCHFIVIYFIWIFMSFILKQEKLLKQAGFLCSIKQYTPQQLTSNMIIYVIQWSQSAQDYTMLLQSTPTFTRLSLLCCEFKYDSLWLHSVFCHIQWGSAIKINISHELHMSPMFQLGVTKSLLCYFNHFFLNPHLCFS